MRVSARLHVLLDDLGPCGLVSCYELADRATVVALRRIPVQVTEQSLQIFVMASVRHALAEV